MSLLAVGWGHPWLLQAALCSLPLARTLCGPPRPHALKLLKEGPMPCKGSLDWVRPSRNHFPFDESKPNWLGIFITFAKPLLPYNTVTGGTVFALQGVWILGGGHFSCCIHFPGLP